MRSKEVEIGAQSPCLRQLNHMSPQVILVTAPIVALDRLNSSVSLDDRRLEKQ